MLSLQVILLFALSLSTYTIQAAFAHENCFAGIIQSRGLERPHLERRSGIFDPTGKAPINPIDPIETDTVDFSYDGSTGPQYWGQFSTTCSTGKYQSPVNFERNSGLTTKSLPALQWPKATNETLNFYNDGHTVKLLFGDLSFAEDLYKTVAPNNKTFSLVEIHFHNPSEHRVESNGKYYSMTYFI